jgi:prophage regulatory protein
MPTADQAFTNRNENIGVVQQSIGAELHRIAAEIVSQVLTQLLGRAYSPRIRLLDLHNVMEATGLGRSTIFQMVSRGEFPQPMRNIGKNMWRESSLIAWMNKHDPNAEE